ncbi:hypothetical protein NPIL_12141 [Nephila pilipes]|uniref:Uncharacterized protein n=1 Tax=Nephila pilipes TaxID=299642 RepID=A0A8X6QYE6_NEPPI|nr:hypothetical protein NPIL_12141 [Nephila pilipes]
MGRHQDSGESTRGQWEMKHFKPRKRVMDGRYGHKAEKRTNKQIIDPRKSPKNTQKNMAFFGCKSVED